MTDSSWSLGSWVWAGQQHVPWVLGAAALGAVFVGVAYRRLPGTGTERWIAAALKGLGIAALLLCLLEPMHSEERPIPGANQLLIVADDSQSLNVRDPGETRSRGEALRERLALDADWQVRAGQQFSLRHYSFGERLRALDDPEELRFESPRTATARALARLRARFEGRPVAGILWFSDGCATEAFGPDFDWEGMPPIYPVVVGSESSPPDAALTGVRSKQTNFEVNPVEIGVEVAMSGLDDASLQVLLRDERGELLDRNSIRASSDDPPRELRFELPGSESGVHFYSAEVELPDGGEEATKENNRRWLVVDRGQGPYRVLYVSGRPNWEFKFLRRAMDQDPELELIGLIRIAKRQPKFSFRDRDDPRNQLFDGFSEEEAETAEQHDEPVLIRLGTRDEFELREGFPQAADVLFEYDAVIVDDLEAAFFTPDQHSLIEDFVSRRGGGFLILGGEDSFLKGGYRRTPVGDLLPVYLDGAPEVQTGMDYSMSLTREGWLEPWIRLRPTEREELDRLRDMPNFKTLNRVGALKPGAQGLLAVEMGDGGARPALAAQRYGKGRAAALMLADLWRWDLAREESAKSDLGVAWRQLLRWLVADVPQRLELRVEEDAGGRRLQVQVWDENYQAMSNAVPRALVHPPEGEAYPIDLEPSPDEAGTWTASLGGRAPGPYRVEVHAVTPDGSELGPREAGWVHEPATEEFRRLAAQREALEEMAQRSGGEVLEMGMLEDFVERLEERDLPMTETQLDPLWHRWWVFLLAIACFCAEWGWRRTRGLA